MLYHGDCLEVMRDLPAASVDMVLCDPPYTSPTTHAFGRQTVKRLSDLAIQEFYFTEIKRAWTRLLKPGAPVIIFCDDIYSAVLTGLFYEWKQTAILIWDKGKIGMGNPFRKQHELLFYACRESVALNSQVSHIPTVLKFPLKKEHHGAEKPVALIELLISGLCPERGVVLDCFMGSGSTGVAAANTGRDFLGIEMDARYFDVAHRRIDAARPQTIMFQETESQ